MNALNTYAVENFLNTVQAAVKTNQRQVVLPIKDAQTIAQALGPILARALGETETVIANIQPTEEISVKMDGGSF